MTGDFNTPSHLDWTPAVDAVRARRQLPGRVARDRGAGSAPASATPTAPSIRTRSRTPGITWTFGYPFPRLAPDEVGRPDRPRPGVGAASQVLDSGIAGPPGTPRRRPSRSTRTRPTTARSSRTVRLTPAAPGPFASVLRPPRRARRPDRRPLRRAARRGRSTGSRSSAPAAARQGADVAAAAGGELLRRVTFGSGGLQPGRYDALLVTRRDRVLSRSTFWVVAPGARPRIAVAAPVRVGRRIRVSWRNAPGLPPRLGRHLEGRRPRPLQRLPRVRLHGRDGGRRGPRSPAAASGTRRAATSRG